MITLLPNLPDDTIGVVASGHVMANDYESVFVPAVQAALTRHKKIKLLYQVDSDLAGFTPGGNVGRHEAGLRSSDDVGEDRGCHRYWLDLRRNQFVQVRPTVPGQGLLQQGQS